MEPDEKRKQAKVDMDNYMEANKAGGVREPHLRKRAQNDLTRTPVPFLEFPSDAVCPRRVADHENRTETEPPIGPFGKGANNAKAKSEQRQECAGKGEADDESALERNRRLDQERE